MSQYTIRRAKMEDAEEILRIYEPFILNTVITFEYDKVPLEVFQERMNKIMDKFPWLVCCDEDGTITGYAYCSSHRERAAYAWDCECTVYMKEEYERRGIASALYEAAFGIVREQGYYNVYALICTESESSVGFHKKFGFTDLCTYYDTAYKFGKWRHLLVMEKRLREAKGEPAPVVSLEQQGDEIIETELQKAENKLNQS